MNKSKPDNKILFRYAGMVTQFIIGISLAIFAGYKIDEYFNFSTSLAVWILPLLVICFMIYKIIKETNPNK